MAVQEDSGNSDAQRAMATEAIAAVSDAAIRRGAEIEHNARKSIRNRILRGFVALSVIGGVIASGAYLWASHQDAKQQLKELNEATKKLDPLPKLADMPVAILVPRTGEGLPASDNAVRQKQGFKQAYEEITDDIYIDFDFGALSLDEEKFSCEEASENECEALKEALKEARKARSSEIERVLTEIKKRYYAKEGPVRIFLITMSGAVNAIKDEFEDWATNKDKDDDVVDSRDRPILIATVASAPDIANRERGVLRHYIRSKDEVAVLSTYIESIESTPDVVVFRVDDDYGKRARDLFRKRFPKRTKPFVLDPLPEKEVVEDKVKKFIEYSEEKKYPVTVIVGYGKMITSTLESLEARKEDFRGQILVVSTFTEKQWRPESLDPDFAKRIYAVGPVGDEDESDEEESDEKGVVYQFSYMTLDRVLQSFETRTKEKDCSGLKGEGGVRADGFAELFWDCWIDKETTGNLKRTWANVEFTAEGDSYVTLKMLEYDAERNDW